MKKTLITLAAAATIATAALVPTSASAGSPHFSFGIIGDGFAVGMGSGHHGGWGPGYSGPHKHCKKVWKKIHTPWGPKWKKVKKCHWH